MARSGSYNFGLNRDEIINGAFREIGVLGESQTASSTRISQASQKLNELIDLWEYFGYGLWLAKEIVLFPQADQILYYFGPSMISTYSDYACLFSEYNKTEVATAGSSGDGTIVVDSASGISSGDYIGIETDTPDIHWTTVNGAPVGTTVTLTDALDADATVDNHVYSFTTAIQRPTEIIDQFRRDSDERDTPMELVSMSEYRAISDKRTESRPLIIAADFQLDDIQLHIWPEPSDFKDRVHLIVKYPLQDFDAATDDWDFPRGWALAIELNLALLLANSYGRDISPLLLKNAEMALSMAAGSDRELASVQMMPDLRSYRR